MAEMDYEWCKQIYAELVSEGALEVDDEEGDEPEQDWCTEVISDWISKAGEVAYRKLWDSGGPGAGAGVNLIYRFRGLYFANSIVELTLSGPFQSLDDALDDEFLAITEATVSIESAELATEDIAHRINFDYYSEEVAEERHVVTINGEKWEVTSDKQIKPARD